METPVFVSVLSPMKWRPHRRYMTVSTMNNGAGEGIRTLDPNLGKIGLCLFWGTLRYS